jgi:hypothetical protein
MINAEVPVNAAAGTCFTVVGEDQVSQELLDCPGTFAAGVSFLVKMCIAVCGVDLSLAFPAVVASSVWSVQV